MAIGAERSATEHRLEVAEWAAKAPANDNEIFGTARVSTSPRHSKMAEELQPIKKFFKLQETVQAESDAFGAANDNEEVATLEVDRNFEIRPTIEELLRAVDAEGGPEDIEYDAKGRLIRMGGLYFNKDGSLRKYWTKKGRRKPKETLRGEKGTKMPGRSISYLRLVLGPNAAALPTIGNPAEAFLGNRIHTSSGSHKQQSDMRREEREEERRYAVIKVEIISKKISEKDARTLDVIERVQGFADVGREFGYTGKTAERQGKRFVTEAADALRPLLSGA